MAQIQRRVEASIYDCHSDECLNVVNGRAQVDVISAPPSGAGVQYTEGDTDTTITGTAILWEDAADTLRAVSVAKPLPVDTELPAEVALADGVANPTTPVIAAYLHAKSSGATTYSRVTSELGSDNNDGDTTDRGSHVSDLVKYFSTTPTAINDTYDGTPTTALSAEIDCRRFRRGILAFSLDSTATPTDIIFRIYFSDVTGGTFFKLSSGFWSDLRFDDTVCATQIDRCYEFPVLGGFMKVEVVTAGTSAVNIFTVTNARVILKN